MILFLAFATIANVPAVVVVFAFAGDVQLMNRIVLIIAVLGRHCLLMLVLSLSACSYFDHNHFCHK